MSHDERDQRIAVLETRLDDAERQLDAYAGALTVLMENITHGDIDWVRKMYWVRNLKHPRFKNGNHKEFAMLDPIPEIFARQPRLRPDDPNERVFPFDSKSVGAKYTLAKKALGIVNLRFHDNRREAITRWLKFLPPHKVKMISGHETTVILERVYDATDPVTLHAELARMTQAAA